VRLLDVCRELNIAVPEEVAILGLGNDPVVCDTVHPTLSSIDLNSRLIGYEAARLLDTRMAGKAIDGPIFVAPSHVAVRQSTDLMAIQDSDVAQAVRFIRQSACKGIDVSRVAKEIGLSRSSLEQRFHRYLERTPAAEIMRVRIEHAKMLLSRTDQTVECIARKSGFASAKYFTRAFRREVGTTPSAYRRSQRISRDSEESP
jgi:LacI family transcriptional regulator